MGRLLSPPTAEILDLDIIVPVAQGGLGGNTPNDIATKLNAISVNAKGLKNGVVNLDATGKIPLTLLSSSSVKAPTLNGPTEIGISQTALYVISNYDAKTTYNVTVSAGTVAVSGNLVSVTASSTAQPITLTINTRSIVIPVLIAQPKSPSLSVIDFGIGSIAGLFISSSAFGMLSGSNTHKSTDWEVSITDNFSNTVFNSYDNQIDKLSITANGLIQGITYFVRARYRDNSNAVGSWSKTYSITTKKSYTLNKEVARLITLDRATTDNLGISVSISGDGSRAAICANYADNSGFTDTGCVYIYTRSGLSWRQEAKLIATDKLSNDRLGFSVSLNTDGSRVAVGSIDNSPGGTSKAGAVYVFLRSGTTWIQESKIFPADKVVNDNFGYSVSLSSDGTRLAIGAPFATMSSKASAGAVYIYSRAGVIWSQEAKFTSTDVLASDNFGTSVSLSLDASRLVAGSPKGDNSSIVDCGSAYVFLRTGTTWSQEAKLIATTLVASSLMGTSVAISGDSTRAVLGAPGLDTSADANTCAAYVFIRTGTTWAQEAKLVASDRIMGDQFGGRVAISSSGNRIAVAAKLGEVSGIIDAGSVYIFSRNSTAWVQESKVTASDKATSSLFGSSVSISSDASILVIGSSAADSGDIVDSGQAYVFTS